MSYIVNPSTRRMIQVGGATYKRLMREGQIGGYEGEIVPSATLRAIKSIYFGNQDVTWMKLLYRPDDLSLIEIWHYFDRDYDGMTRSDVEAIKTELLNAYETNNIDTFLSLLRQLPAELIDNGIMQTISGFERDHDDIDLSRAELDALRDELFTIHNAVVNGWIRLDTVPEGMGRGEASEAINDSDEDMFDYAEDIFD